MKHSSRLVRVLGLLTGIGLIAGTLLVVWIARSADPAAAPATTPPVDVSWGRTAVDSAGLAQRSGVRITQVAVTGGGGLVDLRFQVLDPNLANTLHSQAAPPAVIDEKTGLVVRDLLMNHSHTEAFKAGVTYYLVFENPGGWVRRGSQVTVLLGSAEVRHVVVR
jgi:hypothetical protein